MRIKIPSPLRGWREFSGEVGIIVLGVGIALAADQWMEARHWKYVVAAEDEALVSEIQDNHAALLVRVMLQPCVDRRLAELDTLFRRQAAGEPLGIVAPIGRPTRFTGSASTLAMATAGGSLSHMSLARKQAIFAAYGSYDTFAPVMDEERASWRVLQALDRAGTLGAEDWRELRKAYDGAVDNNSSMRANLRAEREGQWLTAFQAFPPPDTVALRKSLMSLPYVQKLCRPMLGEAARRG